MIVVCPNCEFEQDVSSKSSNYFMSIDIKYQLDLMLKSDNLRSIIIKSNVISKEKVVGATWDTNISDIRDSDIFKKIQMCESSFIISLTFNTDGAVIFNNSQTSMWPVQIAINELGPEARPYNILLTGFLLSKTEPSASLMNLYLKTVLINSINEVNSIGLIYNNENIHYKFKVFLLFASVDSKARPIIQN